jgi:hypothetical protein
VACSRASAAQPQWSHIAFGALVGQQQLLSAVNLLGGLSAAQWLQMLRPFSSVAMFAPRVAAGKPAGRLADTLTAFAGLVFSVALAASASAWSACAHAGSTAALLRGAVCAGAWVCAVGAASSDGADFLELLCRGGSLQVRSWPAPARKRANTPTHP